MIICARILLLISSLLLGAACSLSHPTPFQSLPLPQMNEIATVDGVPLTLTDYLNIRRQMKHPSADQVYWVGVGSLALRKAAMNQGRSFSLIDSSRLSRYAIGDLTGIEVEPELKRYFPHQKKLPTPEEMKDTINRLMSQAWIQKGLIPLSSL